MIVLTGDLHLRLNERYSRRIDGVDLRLDQKFNILRSTVDYAIENAAEAYVLLGDIFERINPPEMVRFMLMERIIFPLTEAGVPIHIISGNHDTNFAIWSLMSEASITDNLTLHKELTEITINNWSLLVAPWGTTPEQIYSYEGDAKVLLAHLDVVGASIGGIEMQTGVYPKRLSKKFKLSVFGHIHKHQILSKTVVLLGSLTRDDRGEAGNEKFFAVLENPNTPKLVLKKVDDWDYVSAHSGAIPDDLTGKVVTLQYKVSDRGRIDALRKLCYDRGAEYVLLECETELREVGTVEAPSQDVIRIMIGEYAKKNQLDSRIGFELLDSGGVECE